MKKIWCFIPEKYKLLVVCVVVFWALLPFVSNGQKRPLIVALDYKCVFGNKYDDALLFISKETWISDSLAIHAIDPKFALAIVFPELIRFSSLQNYIELQGLFTLYVQYGASYANFSVGRFQMKPTFAEQVERDRRLYLKDEVFRAINIFDSSAFRLQRVKRLQSMHWQVQYLIWFIKVMDRKFEKLEWKSPEEKLKFYATAYNCGYQHSETYIRSKMNINSFHTELFTSTLKYNYSDISASYLKQ